MKILFLAIKIKNSKLIMLVSFKTSRKTKIFQEEEIKVRRMKTVVFAKGAEEAVIFNKRWTSETGCDAIRMCNVEHLSWGDLHNKMLI